MNLHLFNPYCIEQYKRVLEIVHWRPRTVQWREENREVLTTARLDGDELLRMKKHLLRTPRQPLASRGGSAWPK
jgi:hypothetical protein